MSEEAVKVTGRSTPTPTPALRPLGQLAPWFDYFDKDET